MNLKNTMKASLILAGLVAGISGLHAQEFNAAADFNPADPNGGAFKYGYVVNGQSTFIPFTNYATNITDSGVASGLDEFGTTVAGDSIPGTIYNPSSGTLLLNSAQYNVAPGALMFYPDGGTLTDLEFVAPTTGTYNISAIYDRTGYMPSPGLEHNSGFLIFTNIGAPTDPINNPITNPAGNQSYFSDANLMGTYEYDATMALTAGQTLDFLVVAGSGPTGLNADITLQTTPEPSTWALLLAGLASCVLFKRMRRTV